VGIITVLSHLELAQIRSSMLRLAQQEEDEARLERLEKQSDRIDVKFG